MPPDPSEGAQRILCIDCKGMDLSDAAARSEPSTPDPLRVLAFIPSKGAKRPASEVRRRALAWFEHRLGKKLPEGAETGKDVKAEAGNRSFLATAARAINEDIWACQLSGPIKGRLITEAVICSAGGRVTRLGFRLLADAPAKEFIENELAGPLASLCELYASVAEFSPKPRIVHSPTETDNLAADLLDPCRNRPVIVLSTRKGTESPSSTNLDSAELAEAVNGLAQVCVVTRRQTWHLAHELGNWLGVFDGAVRIYMPGLVKDGDPTRHRLFPMRQSPDEQETSIVRAALLQRAAAESVSLYQVQDREWPNTYRAVQEKLSTLEKPLARLIRTAPHATVSTVCEAEIFDLRSKLEIANHKLNESETSQVETSKRLDRAQTEIVDLRSKLQAANHKLDESETSRKHLENKLETVLQEVVPAVPKAEARAGRHPFRGSFLPRLKACFSGLFALGASTRLARAKMEIVDLRSNLKAANRKLNESEASRVWISERLDRAQIEIFDLHGKLQAANRKLSEPETPSAETSELLCRAQTEIADLRGKLQAANRKLSESETPSAETYELLCRAQTEIADLRGKLQVANRKLNESETPSAETYGRLCRAETEIVDLRGNLEVANRKLYESETSREHLKNKLEDEQHRYKEIEENNQEIKQQLQQAKAGIDKLESEWVSSQDEVDRAKTMVDKLQAELIALQQLPYSWGRLIAWCDTQLKGKVMLAPTAKKRIAKAQFQDVQTAAKGLHWLANEYRDYRMNGRGDHLQGPIPGLDGVSNERCGGDSFRFDWQGRRHTVEWHLRKGNSHDPRYCLRIYYFWDADLQQAVIADMPAHRHSSAS